MNNLTYFSDDHHIFHRHYRRKGAKYNGVHGKRTWSEIAMVK